MNKEPRGLRSYSVHVQSLLKKTTNPVELKEQAAELIAELGFSDFDFSLIKSEKEIQFLMTTLPQSLINTYNNAGLYEQDMCLEYMIHNSAPIFQSTVDNYIAQSPFNLKRNRQNQIIQQLVTTHDFYDVYIIPMKAENTKGKTSFSVFRKGSNPIDFQNHIKEFRSELNQLAHSINKSYVGYTPNFCQAAQDNTRATLTRRQIQVLDTLAKYAKTSQQAADYLNISARTINKHVEEAKESLGAFSTTNAVYIAIEKGLISTLSHT